MAESSSQNPSSPNLTPKEEPITLDKPNSPNIFLPTDEVEFTFDEMLFTTNNEVARIHPDHPNSTYFQIVSDFISKCCLRKAFISAPTQYVEYLAEFWYTVKALENSRIWVLTPTGGIIGKIGITTFRNAIGAHYLDTYVDSPSLAVVKPWFAEIGYNEEIKVKRTLKKSCLPHRWRLLMRQIIQCLGVKKKPTLSSVVDMRTEQYLTHTNYALWKVIMNGDAPAAIASASAGFEGSIPPKTAKQKLTRKNELKAKSTLLLAILDEHLLKFHGIKDAKSLWEAIKNRFGGNKESKKMQKTILKQNYENFTASNTLSMDDLYNNLKVYELEIKGQSSSNSNSQNVAFISSDNSSSTNETVNTAHSVSAASSKD
ncbi:hypothetical protein Tco_0479472 [Tanacetum coccineum]